MLTWKKSRGARFLMSWNFSRLKKEQGSKNEVRLLHKFCYTISTTSTQSHLVILMRKLSTSSRTFGDKKLEKSVEPAVRDRGGMCCSALLGNGTEQDIRKPHGIREKSPRKLMRHLNLHPFYEKSL